VLEVTSDKNPIIPGRGICDPHIKVFNDVVYLYASHDASRIATDYTMNHWEVWSSQDLKTWRQEARIDPADFYTGPTNEAWAVDVASKNGKYYLYFSQGNRSTGVAVSDTPVGPWTDALGRALLDGSLTGGRDYDPTVFVDDDGQAYIIVGGPEWAYPGQGGYFIAKLGEDMVSLAETPRRVEVDHPGDDKASLNRMGDHYYLTYASHVAVSDNVYGPYRYLGNTGGSLDHGCYFAWRGQSYHAFTIFDPSLWFRASGLCYLHQRSDLMLQIDPLVMEYGAHRYKAEWNMIGAHWYSRKVGGTKRESFRGGFVVSFGYSGLLEFDGIEGAATADTLVLCGATSGSALSYVQISIDGVPWEPLELPDTGGTQGPRFFVMPIPITGVCQNLTLAVMPGADAEVDIDWWSLRSSTG
jgi:hypothetical protein